MLRKSTFILFIFLACGLLKANNTLENLQEHSKLSIGASKASILNDDFLGFHVGLHFFQETPAKTIHTGLGIDGTCLFSDEKDIAFMVGIGPNIVWVNSKSIFPTFSFRPQVAILSCEDVNDNRIVAPGLSLAMEIGLLEYKQIGLGIEIKPFVGFDYASDSGIPYHLFNLSLNFSYAFE